MECRVESLMRNEVLLEYEVGFTFPKRPYQEELEGRILSLIDHQEDQIRLYLMRRSLEVLRKFHWTILGGRSNQLSHVSSPLLSKQGKY
ncbi:hypothetical protein Tco_0241001 [Tanacetum coccineum]